jgi:MarR family transcriptional regulator, organic hydroperoxide resistance regulator
MTVVADGMTKPAGPGESEGESEEELARDIVMLMDELVGRIWVQFQARVAEFSLSGPEVKALQMLDPGRPLSMRELSSRLHANPSNVTVAVGRLEARRLVVRQGGEDRRIRSVLLTDAGLELRRRLVERLARDHPALVGLSSADRLTLRRLLRTLAEPRD